MAEKPAGYGDGASETDGKGGALPDFLHVLHEEYAGTGYCRVDGRERSEDSCGTTSGGAVDQTASAKTQEPITKPEPGKKLQDKMILLAKIERVRVQSLQESCGGFRLLGKFRIRRR